MFKKIIILTSFAILLSSCSAPTVEPVEDSATSTNEATVSPSEEAPAEEIVETVVEENTPEVIEMILSSLRDSNIEQQNLGFFEYRSGVEKASSTDFEYVAILNPAESGTIYFYDSRLGFNAITKLPITAIQSDYGFQGILEYINLLESNEFDITEEFTFRKETTGELVEYFFLVPSESGIAEIKLMFNEDNLIEKSEVVSPTSEYTIEYKYGLDGETLRLMDNAFDPNAPVAEEPVEE